MKYGILKKIAAAAAAVTILAGSCMTSSVLAYSDSCPNTWDNTGSGAKDITQVALSQVGYTETSDDHTKYADWFYGKDKSVPWCAIFISWCANQAGISTDDLSKTALASGYSTSNMSKNSFGTDHAYAFDDTEAKVGDIVYVDTSGNDVSNHVGLVYAVDDDYIYTVEGNSSSKVSKVKYSAETGHRQYSSYTSKAHIVFYARPSYSSSGSKAKSSSSSGNSGSTAKSTGSNSSSSGSSSSTASSSAAFTTGSYKVTAGSLNIRSGASSAKSKIGSLAKGDKVEITGVSGEWGSFSYSGSKGWINLNYAQKVSSSSNSSSSSESSGSYTTGTWKVTSQMNVRSGPDTTYKSLGTISAGTKVKITKVSGRFGCFTYNGKTAWVSLKYAEKVSSTSSSSSSSSSSGSSSSKSSSSSNSSSSSESTGSYSTGTWKVTAESLTVRSEADKTSEALGTIHAGDKYKVTKVSGRFGKVTYRGQTGWISLKYCTKV